MIAYVQEESFSHWLRQINNWIHALTDGHSSAWNDCDILQLLSEDRDTGVSILESKHRRKNVLTHASCVTFGSG